jgi:2'-phosphotransferase
VRGGRTGDVVASTPNTPSVSETTFVKERIVEPTPNCLIREPDLVFSSESQVDKNPVCVQRDVESETDESVRQSTSNVTFLAYEPAGSNPVTAAATKNSVYQNPSYTDCMYDDDSRLSRTMAFLLRHGAVKCGVPIQSDGFMRVEDLLRYRGLRDYGYSPADVRFGVANDAKRRFRLAFDDRGMKVRANQGHSMTVGELALTEILADSDIRTAIHGTYYTHLASILKTGLNCMGRRHIHLARGDPGAGVSLSGMRSDCDVAIYVDVIILCPGDRYGILPAKYFTKVVKRCSWDKA